MPSKLSWYNDHKNIIIVEYQAKPTWNDFYATFDQMGTMLSELAHGVFIIYVVQAIPTGNPTLHLGRVIQDTPKQILGACIVTVGNTLANTLVRTFVGIASKAYVGAPTIQFTYTQEEAIALAKTTLQSRAAE
jgi:hypothetical protein